jgi:hypothetical protein
VKHLLFFGLPVLAILPAFATRWRWFAVLSFVAAGSAAYVLAKVGDELKNATQGGGPAFVAFALYFGLVVGLFAAACAVRLAVMAVLFFVRRRRASLVAGQAS